MFCKKLRKKIYAVILVVTVLISAVYREELFAKGNDAEINDLPRCIQAQMLEVEVQGHGLKGKHKFPNAEIADYKDGILSTLDGEAKILEEEAFAGDVYKNDSSFYSNQVIVSARECSLSGSIVAENDIQITADNITAIDEESCVIYSKSGNITMEADAIQVSGILYAPESSITLKGKDVHVNGAIVAKNITVVADVFELDGYPDSDLQKLEWIKIPDINSNFTTVDTENRKLIFHLENNEKTDIYARQEGNLQFEFLETVTEDKYEVSFENIQGVKEYRTVAQRFGESLPSVLFTYASNGEDLEETELDTDGDGIADGYEIWDLGTDFLCADTDGDGFSDGYEVFILHSNPLEVTESIDSDGDGISDKEEMQMGTNPHLCDTDFDGIMDSIDSEPLLTDVASGQEVNYEVEVKTGVFDVCSRYYDENGVVFESVYNYVNGTLAYVNAEGSETKFFYNAQGYEIASIQPIEGEYIVNTHTYDESGNVIRKTYNGMKYDYTYDEAGNVLESSLGERTLLENSYQDDQIAEMIYGNGDIQKQEYDDEGNLIRTFINGEIVYEWEYEEGYPISYKDYISDKSYRYEYDSQGYLVKTICSDGFTVEYLNNGEYAKILYSYEGESISKTVDIVEEGEDSMKVELSCGNDTYVTMVEEDNLTTHFVTDEGDVVAKNEKEIVDGEIVVAESIQDEKIEYEYDELGNITEIKKDGVVAETYEYDSLGQLVREDSLEKGTTTINEYDLDGNVISSTKFGLDMEAGTEEFVGGERTEYAYEDDSWRDLLTSYNGNDILYDEIGNPIKYYNGMEFKWIGRQLVSVQRDGKLIDYSYDSEGLRIGKTVDGKHTDYFWENGNLIGEHRADGTVWYIYDACNVVVGFQYNGESYYFNKNQQGDVLSILDKNGTVLVEYTYDVWGNIIEISGNQTLGEMNPIRYRGYYQDTETGFYYLQSRYYDALTGRFLNADNILDCEAGHAEGNLFSYVGNNSVMRIDPSGHESITVNILTVVVVLVLVYYLSHTFLKTMYKNVNKIVNAMIEGLQTISPGMSSYKKRAKSIFRAVERSFSKAKKKYNTKELHHIVAKGDYRANDTRIALAEVGIGIDGVLNTIWLKKGFHKRIHRKAYYALVNEIILRCKSMSKTNEQQRRRIVRALRVIKETLAAGDRMAPF